jgi:hypothetical protein
VLPGRPTLRRIARLTESAVATVLLPRESRFLSSAETPSTKRALAALARTVAGSSLR